MDVTPHLLHDVEFREQWRGYSREDVDEFLERLAVAIGELQERLQDASQRAARAERQLLERSDDDELRRTLVLAQRTADAAREEAEAEARRVIEEAEARATRMVAEAEERLARLEGEIAAREAAELGRLSERRAGLQADVEALDGYLAEHRRRLGDELRAQLAWLDSPGRLELPPPPPLSAAEPVPPVAPPSEETAPATSPPSGEWNAPDGRHHEGESQVAPEDRPEPRRDEGSSPADASTVAEFPDEGYGPPTGAYDALADLDDDEDAIDLDAERSSAESDDDTDDPFLAELRRAVTDDEPLGPRDHEPGEHLHEDRDEVPSGRFRKRRRE